jgi:ribosomal protein S5
MSLATGTASAPCPVADVMRRVQAQLQAGRAPSFEALLALGEPRSRAGV